MEITVNSKSFKTVSVFSVKFNITCQELSLKCLGLEALETILDYISFWFLLLISLELVDFKMEERGKRSFCVWF